MEICKGTEHYDKINDTHTNGWIGEKLLKTNEGNKRFCDKGKARPRNVFFVFTSNFFQANTTREQNYRTLIRLRNGVILIQQ